MVLLDLGHLSHALSEVHRIHEVLEVVRSLDLIPKLRPFRHGPKGIDDLALGEL